jgi:hypothetical protein
MRIGYLVKGGNQSRKNKVGNKRYSFNAIIEKNISTTERKN